MNPARIASYEQRDRTDFYPSRLSTAINATEKEQVFLKPARKRLCTEFIWNQAGAKIRAQGTGALRGFISDIAASAPLGPSI